MAVEFSYQKKKFSLQNKARITEWLGMIAFSESREIETIEYIFCDDDYLLGINKDYLKHDFYTDIITFDYSVKSKIGGDILISIDRVKENAKTFSVTFQDELLRVMAHGLLHLCGYKDKKKADQKIMRSREDECILLWKEIY